MVKDKFKIGLLVKELQLSRELTTFIQKAILLKDLKSSGLLVKEPLLLRKKIISTWKATLILIERNGLSMVKGHRL